MTAAETKSALEQAHGDLQVLAGLLDVLDEVVAADMPLRSQLALIGIRHLAEHARDASGAALS